MAQFAAELRFEDIPAEVIGRAKAIILDGLGCGLFAADVAWTRILVGTLHKLDPAEGCASVWGRGYRTSPVHAVLLNGTMVQGYEIDDANQACFHACAVILPAVFAAAEYIGADKIDGKALLTAIIAGFEIGPRIGLCLDGDEMIVKGWHSPGIFGAFPAAVSAGRILGLDANGMHHALGMAGTQASGLMSAQFGSMIKRVQCAKNSQSGLYSAFLAADGFTGIEDIFDRGYGDFCRTFTQTADGFDLAQLTDGLGERWETMRIDYKRHASLGTNFAAIDAVEQLVARHGFGGDDVEDVLVEATNATVSHGGWPYEPTATTGMTAAQMNLAFCVAMQIIEGEVFVDQMVETNIARPDLVALAQRVRTVRDVEREKRGLAFARGATVHVRLKNGQTFSCVQDHFIGSHHQPLTDEQVAAKFRKLAVRTLESEDVGRIEEIVWSLDAIPSVAELADLLRGPVRPAA
jgi:2-methylcitrate dehydratase PrpD